MKCIVSLRAFTFLLFILSCLFLIALPNVGQIDSALTKHANDQNWRWKDQQGRWRTRADIDEMFRKHKQWLASGRMVGDQAVFNGAMLNGVNLTGVDLSGCTFRGALLREAILTRAIIWDTNFDGTDLGRSILRDVRARAKASFTDAKLEDADFGDNANLIGIDFTRAYLVGVKLQGADLREARLSEAMLGRANLAKAKLDSADLRSAKLDGADLASASLIDADLAGARLHGTDMTGAIFEPKSLPAIRDIAAAENLESLIYTKNPDALFELRKKFQDGGFRDQERKITYALKSRETQLLGENCRGARDFWNCVAYFLNKAGFDLTCQYGMDPWRPIKIAAGVWVVCTLLYFLFIRVGGQSGLFRINARPTDDPVGARSSPQADKIKPIALQGAKGSHFVGRLVWRELRVLGTAMFFSTMSSFNIGFREINFGRWLRMLTRQEFDIKAVGWARVVAGVQSLISFYMVVLWVLTYFGRPFE